MKADPRYISQTLVPEYVRNLQIYQAGKPIDELMREKGLKRISKLASNENPLGPSPLAIEKMAQGLKNLHRYPDMHAFALKSALTDLYGLKRENIILGNGSEGIMSYIIRAFLQPGSEALTSENTFIGFSILARSVGANLKTVPLNKNSSYDIQALGDAINDHTKIIYIANPNNPTGTYIKKQEFDSLMEKVPGRILVILDEAYFEFANTEKDYPDSMDYRYDNVLTLRTFSKAYGLAGIRVGYGFGHENLIGDLHKVKLPFEPNLISQLGAQGALLDRSFLEKTIETNNQLKSHLENFLQEKGFSPIPSVTNFITFKTGSEKASHDLFESLLDQGVIIRTLKVNEMPEFVRVSIGTSEEISHFYEAMEKILPRYDAQYGRPQ